jgi:hypothetical protein
MSRQSMQFLWAARSETPPLPKMINKEVAELVAA